MWIWFTCLKPVELLQGVGLCLITKSPGVPGTPSNDLRRMKD